MSKIMHERMRAIIDFNSPHYEEMIMYIKQQEKQEKLLGLYQRLYKDFNILTLDGQLEIEKQIKDLEKQIRELENE